MSALLRDSGTALLREARFEEGLLLLLAYAESGWPVVVAVLVEGWS